MDFSRDDTIFLFDVDGTLTMPRKEIDVDFYKFLVEEVKPRVKVALVGGSDLEKILEQMRGASTLDQFDFVFSENGLLAFESKPDGRETLSNQSILKYMGEEKLQKFINFALGYLSQLTLPCKRGNFIEFRTGMINVCPVGRSCTYDERLDFVKYDQEHHIRDKLIEALKKEFPDLGLTFAIGGQISIDVYPNGWNKTFCLKFLKKYPKIYFFGDKTNPGENDHEIYEDSKTIGHTVTGPENTKELLKKILGI